MPVPRFFTVLMAASDHGHVEVVRILLEAGADENLVDIDGFTALILASEQGHGEVVRMLCPPPPYPAPTPISPS